MLAAAEQQDAVAAAIRAAVIPALVDSVEAVVKQAQLHGSFDVVMEGTHMPQQEVWVLKFK